MKKMKKMKMRNDKMKIINEIIYKIINYLFLLDVSTSSAKPRVKPEALANARKQQGRELAYLFNPSMKVIPIGHRPGM